MKKQKKIYILSCCGGGTRGIIPSLILDKITELTGKHPTDLFDIMIGSSTGAIITTILNIPNDYTIDITLTDTTLTDTKDDILLDSIKPFVSKPKYNTNDLIHIYENALVLAPSAPRSSG